MDADLKILKLFLDELGIGSKIKTVEDRLKIQKAVYLGQVSGLDLGYRFGWYVKGPYCSSLADDYYELETFAKVYEDELSKLSLGEKTKAKLEKAKTVIQSKPDSIEEDSDWLELVASYDYLIRVRGLEQEGAKAIIKEKKGNLFPHVDEAIKALKKAMLL